MVWVPFIVAAIFFAVAVAWWFTNATRITKARKAIPNRVIVVGSRGKSGTVRLVDAALQHNGIPTYSKITGTIAQEITVDDKIIPTFRMGPVSAGEMTDTLMRAYRQKAQAVVFECMAVSPKLISLVQNRMIQASVAVLPTIRLDHLEDEGDTIAGITKGIIEGLRGVDLLVTGEQNEDALRVIDHWAHQHQVTVIRTTANDQTPVIPGHHPTNIETACAVAAHFGISREDAITAMFQATSEPDSEIGWEVTSGTQTLRFSDLGGANDPQSAGEAIARAQVIAQDGTIIPIVVSRWDRPLRAIAFAYSLRANPNTPHVGIIGSATPQVKLALRRQGFKPEQIKRIGVGATIGQRRSLHTLFKMQGTSPKAWFTVVENIHAGPADRLRTAIHKAGKAIFVADLTKKGEHND